MKRIEIDYLVGILKKVLEGDENKFFVEFGDEETNINFILDICNKFREEIERCPLPDVEGKSDNLSRCDVCGNKFEAHESGFCPYCNTGYISKQ